ncbi:hypothetical protein OBBRIDRAFT_799359 [Obba rivulosa]|uniref:Uncharacterized protein n=1 Tax=Obba rivulosa TaxID=1052685 RepID=A0A8E2ALD9_9APHY|nr:hypothetical protein OBBRIDRAFT_799359 [Obba rivulosa]
MPDHDDHRDDHRDEHRDAHVVSLRLALGSILAPKRPPYTRASTTTSGTASPAWHGHASGAALPPHALPPFGVPSPLFQHHLHHPHRPAQTSHHRTDASTPAPPSAPMVSRAASAPDATTGSPLPADAQVPAAAASGSTTPHHRADFVGTLQSKSAWDALIHGSWV